MRSAILTAALVLTLLAQRAICQDLTPLLKSESDRVAVVEKVKPAVVAIFANGGKGGGSGVLINEAGYALTNFHVVQPAGPTMQCGLADGVLYDAVLVGLDKVGDVALIKLLPKGNQKFPFAPMGDSDKVHEGDWSIAMGNPFLLATDFTPTVTFGLVSGVHRYQYPAGTFLEYTDCIQIDTSINPGNSGGPLFNMQGELIGINGRGSFDKRGRVNSGVGYAISINQIKNFLGHLMAGLDTDHATLGAVVTTQTEQTGVGRMLVTNILEDSDVARRGLEYNDEILSFGGRPVSSVNHFKNVLGIYPRGWRMPLEYRREQTRKEILVRLMGVQRKQIEGDGPMQEPKKIVLQGNPAQGPAAKFYEPKPGFANYYFNKVERDRVMAAFTKQGDFQKLTGNWSISGEVRLKKNRNASPLKLDFVDVKEGGSTRSLVKIKIGDYDDSLEPLKDKQEADALRLPATSGGLLSALFLYRQLLTQGEKSFPSEFFHGGSEPIYPPAPANNDGKAPSLASLRVDAEVIHSRLGTFQVKWFFARTDQKLLGMEVRLKDNEDPCEVYFEDYRPEDGRMLPHRMQVVYADSYYGNFTFTNFKLAAE